MLTGRSDKDNNDEVISVKSDFKDVNLLSAFNFSPSVTYLITTFLQKLFQSDVECEIRWRVIVLGNNPNFPGCFPFCFPWKGKHKGKQDNKIEKSSDKAHMEWVRIFQGRKQKTKKKTTTKTGVEYKAVILLKKDIKLLVDRVWCKP